MRRACSVGAALFLPVGARAVRISKLEDYYHQEAFEANRRFQQSTTYPGSIKAATPGDTQCYMGPMDTVLHGNQRHYWRAVTDDPEVQSLIPVRVQFREQAFTGEAWEDRLHVIQVTVPRDATIAQIVHELQCENSSPYVARGAFFLTDRAGRALAPEATLESSGLLDAAAPNTVGGCVVLAAVDEAVDHVRHEEAQKPRDWNVHEVPASLERESPYRELGLRNVGKPGKGYGDMKFHGLPSAVGIEKYGRVRLN